MRSERGTFYRDDLTEIYWGDCGDVLAGMQQEDTDLVVTSPPYNCRKPYPGGDEWDWAEYYLVMGGIIGLLYRKLRDGGVLALNIPGVVRWQAEHSFADTWEDYDADYETHRNGEPARGKGRIEPVGWRLWEIMYREGFLMREYIVWVKGGDNNAICSDYRMGSDNNPYMRPCHELILLGSKKQWHHRGGSGRRGDEAVPFMDYTKDVWHIPPARSGQHPAVFPEEIPWRLMRLFIHSEDAVVLDPFMGSGTTLRAARRLGLRNVGIERAREYCAVAAGEFRQLEMGEWGEAGAKSRMV